MKRSGDVGGMAKKLKEPKSKLTFSEMFAMPTPTSFSFSATRVVEESYDVSGGFTKQTPTTFGSKGFCG